MLKRIDFKEQDFSKKEFLEAKNDEETKEVIADLDKIVLLEKILKSKGITIENEGMNTELANYFAQKEDDTTFGLMEFAEGIRYIRSKRITLEDFNKKKE